MDTSYEIRDKIIPIPTDKYTKIMLLGTTGAGKTTLLRQLIGTDPDTEKFPSTSPSRTTIHDIEIIAGNFDKYSAVVTFLSLKETQLLIEECVKDAIITYIASKNEDEMMRRFLTHKDNRFRLSYIIGKPYSSQTNNDEDDATLFDDEEEYQEVETPFVQSEIIQNRLKIYKDKLISISNSTLNYVSSFFNIDISKAAKDEKETVIDLIEDALTKNNDELSAEFNSFLNELFIDIKQKFSLIEKGKVEEIDNWFSNWTFETSNRIEFIKTVNQFSSNYANDYGKLLTPIVSGVRVKGKFKAKNDTEFRNFVLIDGEGLGHTTETSTSLSNHITQKFSQVDAIILVDTAQTPMLAAPTVAIKSIIEFGQTEKLILAFTHFDLVKGDTFVNMTDRKYFVHNIIENILDKIEKEIGKDTRRNLKEIIDKNTVFLSNLQNKQIDKFTNSEIRKLIGLILEKTNSSESEKQSIAFDSSFLEKHILNGINDFHIKWDSFLGVFFHPGFPKLHWAKLKAFNRRVAENYKEGYSELTPSADLISYLNRNIAKFLEDAKLLPLKPDDKAIYATIEKIKNETSNQILNFVSKEILINQNSRWEIAYEYSGAGSSTSRSLKIKEIFNSVTLDPRKDLLLMNLNTFVEKIKEIVKNAIEHNNCKLI